MYIPGGGGDCLMTARVAHDIQHIISLLDCRVSKNWVGMEWARPSTLELGPTSSPSNGDRTLIRRQETSPRKVFLPPKTGWRWASRTWCQISLFSTRHPR
jgi:hypothetical protein